MLKAIVFTLALVAGTVNAQSQSNTPVTTSDQLLGCWRLIDLSPTARKKIDEVEIGAAKYQWFCFESEGTLRSLSSSEPLLVTTKSLRESFAILPVVEKFEIVKPGWLKTVQLSTNQAMVWLTVFTGNTLALDEKIIEKDTLVMGLFDLKKQRPVYWRYLTRMKPNE